MIHVAMLPHGCGGGRMVSHVLVHGWIASMKAYRPGMYDPERASTLG